MHEIKLTVNKDNLDTVLNILQNLKAGLIDELDVDGSSAKQKPTRYKPKANKVIYEEDSGTNDRSGKYINPLEYKKRLNRNV